VDQLNSNGTSPFVDPNGSPAQTAQCFVYQNAYTDSNGISQDAPVMFAVSCPPSGVCDTPESQFFAGMFTYFGFTCTENPSLVCPAEPPSLPGPSSFGSFTSPYGPTSVYGLPAVGFLQGAGPDPNNPCNPAAGTPLFQTNQIVSYTLGDTSSKPMVGGSTGLTSCWVATYDTPGEIPIVAINTINSLPPGNGEIYAQNSNVPANYTCTAISTAPDSIYGSSYPNNGPYLTLNTCEAVSAWSGGSTTSPTCAPASGTPTTCTATTNLDTSVTGPHTFTVDVVDSATNTAASQPVTYYVGSSSVTVGTNPSGLTFTVDGVPYNSPQIFTWGIGSQHSLTTSTPQSPAAGTQDAFSGWSDGTMGTTDLITVSSAITSYTANFNTSYLLTTAASPSNGGSITASGYYASGTGVTLTVTTNPGYVFTGWTGSPVAVTNASSSSAASVIMNAPETVTANFSPTVQVTVGTSPTGLSFSVDSTPYSSPVTLTWTQGTLHTIATTSPQTAGGVQNTFASWSDGGALSHSVTAPSTTTTYTASFSRAYQLTTGVNPSGGGTVTPASGNYYAASTVVPLVATPAAGYVFSSWTGAVANASSASTTLTMGAAPQSVTANFGSALSISPSSLNFGTLNQGTITTQVLTLINTGHSAITMTEPFISLVKGQDDAFVILSWCGKSLAPGAKCFITVSFIAGPYYSQQVATLNVMDNAPGNPQAITLTATVVDPQASLSASSLSFGTLAPNSITTKTVTLKNTGGTTLTISNITLSGSSVFTLGSSATPCGNSLASGASCIIDVTFKPTAKASYSGTLQITDNAITGSTQRVSLTGAGN
jgi:uncharacterized repeat protein (TIGR02543 family)